MKQLRVIVCGGRDFERPAFIWTKLDEFHATTPIGALIQGGGRGVDRIAAEWARTRPEIERHVCRANWANLGRAAGPIRNGRMLEWLPDAVLAFPGGPGTADMVAQAERAGVRIVKFQMEEAS